ncbi:hypothetical protein P153DRAFT_391348 [Dothidotthia symphoricarpi CBS 119687]|uniref:Uncharacterized protein n=1 Tax=Dothidotthia symphoricarpi CBS 119687 TaxID=1392245 RepID=A0A6A5ZV79_9PLEO|nr:uncharacterized protein P153DRAFT_391348 [Dothidotthia symphoricarpi CBS 119687]KAF2123622.1 hypothetical protein P153DRAFT_391348 [Dothidotthia symphoricarpi CBS 119687]
MPKRYCVAPIQSGILTRKHTTPNDGWEPTQDEPAFSSQNVSPRRFRAHIVKTKLAWTTDRKLLSHTFRMDQVLPNMYFCVWDIIYATGFVVVGICSMKIVGYMFSADVTAETVVLVIATSATIYVLPDASNIPAVVQQQPSAA